MQEDVHLEASQRATYSEKIGPQLICHPDGQTSSAFNGYKNENG